MFLFIFHVPCSCPMLMCSVGTLSFGLGIVGIVAGVYTIVNVFLNIYVLRKNPYYKKYVEQQEQELMTKAYSSQAKDINVMQTIKTTAKIAKATSGNSEFQICLLVFQRWWAKPAVAIARKIRVTILSK